MTLVLGGAVHAQDVDLGLNAGFADYPGLGNKGFYMSGSFSLSTKHIVFGFGVDWHNREDYGARAIVPNISILPKIAIERSYLYIGPMAGVIMVDYDFPARNAPARDVSTFLVGGRIGGSGYLTKRLALNVDVSPRILLDKENPNLRYYPSRYMAVSAGLRIRL